MKCPKCGYIGFEAASRCRNCGYEFALASPPESGDDLLLTDTEIEPGPIDVPIDRASRPTPARRRRHARSDRRDVPSGGPGEDPVADMPLFGPLDDEAPLVRPAPTPRAPLSVRRMTPAPARTSGGRRDADQAGAAFGPAAEAEATGDLPIAAARWQPPEGAASVARRAGAALIDVMLSAALDLAVVYFTLRICRLAPEEAGLLPVVPLGLFLLLLNGGYLFVFTAVGGQTIGKMAAGIRVTGSEGEPAGPGQSGLRSLAAIAFGLPFGLSFVACLFGSARRALHDRLTGTWVVPARDLGPISPVAASRRDTER